MCKLIALCEPSYSALRVELFDRLKVPLDELVRIRCDSGVLVEDNYDTRLLRDNDRIVIEPLVPAALPTEAATVIASLVGDAGAAVALDAPVTVLLDTQMRAAAAPVAAEQAPAAMQL